MIIERATPGVTGPSDTRCGRKRVHPSRRLAPVASAEHGHAGELVLVAEIGKQSRIRREAGVRSQADKQMGQAGSSPGCLLAACIGFRFFRSRWGFGPGLGRVFGLRLGRVFGKCFGLGLPPEKVVGGDAPLLLECPSDSLDKLRSPTTGNKFNTSREIALKPRDHIVVVSAG